MPWKIRAGPEQVAAPNPGEVSWAWKIVEADAGAEQTVEVVVSELANDTVHARAAIGSRGRLAVEGILGWQEPPRRIRCTLVGFVCEGGTQ